MKSHSFETGRSMTRLWALVVSLLLAHNAYMWLGQRMVPDTDIVTWMPVERRDPLLRQAFSRMVDTAQQRVVVLIGADNWGRASRAADSYLAVLKPHGHLLQVADLGRLENKADWLAQLQPYRIALITQDAEAALANQPASYWVESAARQLYRPFSGPKAVSWQDDPFGLFGEWLQARAQETPVRPRDGRLFVSDGQRQYVVLPMTLQSSAVSIANQRAVVPLLEQARRAARKSVPGSEVISAGVVLHAAAAGTQAQAELSTIGAGSMIGIVLLIWFTFRSLKPVLWVMLSVAIGFLGAVSICALIYERIHLLTLVFGASLIGVAQDYGIYFWCHRSANGTVDSESLLRQLLPALLLTWITTLIGYWAMLLTPFPGLRQVVLFSTAGLICAWLTVVFWFPALAPLGSVKAARPMPWLARSLGAWPLVRADRRTLLFAAAFVVFATYGMSNLSVQDDIRLLQNPPKRLVAEQIKLSRLLDAPSPVQFYLVRGATPETVLRAEEALRQRLDLLIEKKVFGGYQAISNWVPSLEAQERRRAAVERTLFAKNGPLKTLASQLGEADSWVAATRERLLAPRPPLTPELFLQSPGSEPWRDLWIGKIDNNYASVVAVRNVTPAKLPALRAAATGLQGVEWVDKVGEISSLLADYRRYMSWVVLVSYLGVYLLLLPRYRGRAWRAVAPIGLASVATLALFGAAGVSLQLFHVLALLLLLGIGVDYGIFFQEHPLRRDPTAWLATVLSSFSTLLSFGLLGLSQTPALRAFGLTMSIGIATVVLIVPCFAGGRAAK
jgi:predicted exporter